MMYKKEKKLLNIEFLLPYILTLLFHVTVTYNKQYMLVAQDEIFFFPANICCSS